MDSQDDVVKTIQCNRSKVTLVGTAHVSRQSVELVEERINSDEYDCVAVELCEPRLNNLTDSSTWKNLDVFQIFRHGYVTSADTGSMISNHWLNWRRSYS